MQKDKYLGPDLKLRVIPLWLKRVFSRELNYRARSAEAGGAGARRNRGGKNRGRN